MFSMSVFPDLFFGKTKLLFGSLDFGLVCCQFPIGLFGVVLLAVQPRSPLLWAPAAWRFRASFPPRKEVLALSCDLCSRTD